MKSAPKRRKRSTCLFMGDFQNDLQLTWVDVAVAHSVRCVLTVSIPLAEEDVGASASLGEGGGVRGVTEVHHLVGGEESLVASLVPLAQFLCGTLRFESHSLGGGQRGRGLRPAAVPWQCLSASQSRWAAPALAAGTPPAQPSERRTSCPDPALRSLNPDLLQTVCCRQAPHRGWD